MDGHAKFFFEVAVGPEVVVAHMVMDGQSGVGEFCDGAHDAGTSFGHHVVVFVPKVEDVPDEVEFSGGLALGEPTSFRGVTHPTDKRPFTLPREGGVGRAQVQVGSQVDASWHHSPKMPRREDSRAPPRRWVAKMDPSRSMSIV